MALPPVDSTTLGQRIRFCREEKGWTQDQLGDRLGVAGIAVSRWENNRRPPSREQREAMADLFDVDHEFLDLPAPRSRFEGPPAWFVSHVEQTTRAQEDIARRLDKLILFHLTGEPGTLRD